jgi:hypothetical protein
MLYRYYVQIEHLRSRCYIDIMCRLNTYEEEIVENFSLKNDVPRNTYSIFTNSSSPLREYFLFAMLFSLPLDPYCLSDF